MILMGDLYKYTHWLQLPIGTTQIYSYVESRGAKIAIPYTVFFGLQGFIKEYLEGKVIEQWMIDEAKEILTEAFGTDQYFNEKAFLRLLEKHNGALPIQIKAVKEGSKVPVGNVLVTITNTDAEFPWIVQWVETMLLRAIWYPKGVATISAKVRETEKYWAKICGCELNPFFLNDFGARGCSSHETAEIGGSAHLTVYCGTDTVEAIRWAKQNYGNTAWGGSVFATEHSTTTIYGKLNELTAYTNFLEVAPKDKIVSIVIDSYDTENAVKNLLGGNLKDVILNRSAPTVFRPDSGNPIDMSLNVVSWLWEIFGGTINTNGFKVLNPKVKCIYGDGISTDTIEMICCNLVKNDFSIENIIFGMGGKLLQSSVDRDTFMDACKVSYAEINGIGMDIYKEPKTDSKKNSKRGKLKLIKIDNKYTTVKENEYPEIADELEVVFENGKLIRYQTFQEIRNLVSQ